MKGITFVRLAGMFLLAGLLSGVGAMAQTTGQQPATPPAQADKDKAPAPVAGLTLDSGAAPVSADEDAAMKAFRDAPSTDATTIQKKLQIGDDFLQKYPQSRYRTEVYGWQVRGFLSVGQVEKMETAREKELELNPNDPQTLAILGSAIPRSIGANTPNPTELLAKAEGFCKKALELLPTIVKPATLPDEQFVMAKNQTSAMAYSGLGLVAFRRGKYTDAIPNLEQSVKLDPNPDPVNYFILAVSNEKASHFDDAVTAFTKCSAIQSPLQTTCKAGIDEAKKLGSTQLSVPK